MDQSIPGGRQLERNLRDISEVCPPRKTFYIEPKNRNSFGKMPYKPEDQNKLADELIEWALQDDSLFWEKFAISKFITARLFINQIYKTKNEYLVRAFEFAKSCCSMRQIEGNHKINDSIIQKFLPLYNDFYSEYLLAKEKRDHEYQKDLKAMDAQKNGPTNITVLMDSITSSDMKPCLENK